MTRQARASRKAHVSRLLACGHRGISDAAKHDPALSVGSDVTLPRRLAGLPSRVGRFHRLPTAKAIAFAMVSASVFFPLANLRVHSTRDRRDLPVLVCECLPTRKRTHVSP